MATDDKDKDRDKGKTGATPGMPGDEHVFGSGAKRSEVMPFYSAIPVVSLRRVALRATGAPKGGAPLLAEGFKYEGGSRGYGYGNWRRGLPMEDTLNHIYNHLGKWRTAIESGKPPNDDDLAAIAWGVLMPLMTFERDYADQYAMRNSLLGAGKTADVIDAEMQERWGAKLLIHPLAPEKRMGTEGAALKAEDEQCAPRLSDIVPVRPLDWCGCTRTERDRNRASIPANRRIVEQDAGGNLRTAATNCEDCIGTGRLYLKPPVSGGDDERQH